RFIIPRQALLFHLLFFFNAPPPTEIYTLSLHDALPISPAGQRLWSAPAHGLAGLRRRLASGAAAAGRGRAGISATAGPLAPRPGAAAAAGAENRLRLPAEPGRRGGPQGLRRHLSNLRRAGRQSRPAPLLHRLRVPGGRRECPGNVDCAVRTAGGGRLAGTGGAGMSETRNLPLTLPLKGSRLIEASAGTGKTFTISALYVRLVLGHGGEALGFGRALLPPEILVVTFTEAATQELRDRIRKRLAESARH